MDGNSKGIPERQACLKIHPVLRFYLPSNRTVRSYWKRGCRTKDVIGLNNILFISKQNAKFCPEVIDYFKDVIDA